MDYQITHRTVYKYTEPVSVSHHAAHLEPLYHVGQRCLSFNITVTPQPAVLKTRTDYFGNQVCVFSLQELHQRLEVTTHSRVSVVAPTPQVLALSPPWREVSERFRDPVSPDDVQPYEFCLESPLLGTAPFLAEYAAQSFPGDTPLLVGASDLMRRIYQDFQYDPRATTVATPLAEV